MSNSNSDLNPPAQPHASAHIPSTTSIATHPLAAPTLADSTFKPINMSRTPTHNGRGHTLTGLTWNTPDTIASLHSFYRHSPPPSPQSLSNPGASPSNSAPSPSTPSSSRPPLASPQSPPAQAPLELRRFYVFGTGLNAHPATLHGGVVATILDSSLGGAVALASSSLPPSSHDQHQQAATYYTALLNTTYKLPVRTPGMVRVRAWIDVERTDQSQDGRKVWAKGVVEGWDALREKVVTHAEAEGLWVRTTTRTRTRTREAKL
jgi:acyl-coenzyme A thioesterase PaaI-like protein